MKVTSLTQARCVNRQRFATVQQWQVESPKAVSFCGSCETLLSWEQVRAWRISLWILTWVSWPHDATAEQQMDHLIVRYPIHHDVCSIYPNCLVGWAVLPTVSISLLHSFQDLHSVGLMVVRPPSRWTILIQVLPVSRSNYHCQFPTELPYRGSVCGFA